MSDTEMAHSKKKKDKKREREAEAPEAAAPMDTDDAPVAAEVEPVLAAIASPLAVSKQKAWTAETAQIRSRLLLCRGTAPLRTHAILRAAAHAIAPLCPYV